jgi:hypothetical protein
MDTRPNAYGPPEEHAAFNFTYLKDTNPVEASLAGTPRHKCPLQITNAVAAPAQCPAAERA